MAAGPAAAQVAATPQLPEEHDAEQAAALVRALELHYPLTLALLEREFPADHAALMAVVEEIGGGEGQPVDLLLAASQQLAEVRRKYADRVVFAPGVSHPVMLGLLADFYDSVLATDGASVCGRFAHDGSAVLFELGLSGNYAGHLDRQSVAYFESVVLAIEAPEIAGALQPEDMAVLLAAMVRAGAPPSYVAAIAGGRPNDPNLCAAYAALFRTSGLLDSPEGARTRADFAKNLAGY